MIFTDEKLKNLKGALGVHPDKSLWCDRDRETYKAILSRLEAAEKVCKDVEPMVDHYDLKSWYKWRKVAGKE